MTPELFNPAIPYGPAVDIWAFGSVVYEMALGLPPNTIEFQKAKIDITQFGQFLRGHIPRLNGLEYSAELEDLVVFYLEESPDGRPTIEQVMDHRFICDANSRYPAEALSELVRTFKIWEYQGGARESLFNPMIGAQAPTDRTSIVESDEWNFSTTTDFDEKVGQSPHDPGNNAQLKPNGRRRPPPRALARPKAPSVLFEKTYEATVACDEFAG